MGPERGAFPPALEVVQGHIVHIIGAVFILVKENHINGLLIKEEETTEADTTTAATTDETTTDTETVTDSQTAPAAEDSKETTGVPNSKKAANPLYRCRLFWHYYSAALT